MVLFSSLGLALYMLGSMVLLYLKSGKTSNNPLFQIK
jgi:hypothetical protein